jgi:hypothetical protein
MVPPKNTHACLLGQVYMPTDTSPAGSHVWDKNNLAQKNMTVVAAERVLETERRTTVPLTIIRRKAARIRCVE